MSNYVTVSEFITMIDYELKQYENQHRTTVNDSMRLSKEAETIQWINQALGELLEHNKGFYYRIKGYTPSADTATIELPYFIRRLDKIYVNSEWHNVSYYGDDNFEVWYDGGRTIRGNGITFPKDVEVMLRGIQSPDKVIDTNSVIDFPPSYIRLLLLQVLLYFSGRDNRKKEIWFAQYQLLLLTYKRTSTNVGVHGSTTAPFGFGNYIGS